jgi:hypothetical protein
MIRIALLSSIATVSPRLHTNARTPIRLISSLPAVEEAELEAPDAGAGVNVAWPRHR